MTDRKMIYLDDAINALEREKTYSAVYKYGYTQTDYFKQYNMGLTDGIKALNKLPSAQPEQSSEIKDILEYLDTVLHPIISPDHWNVYSELHDMISMLPSAQPVDKDINVPTNDSISRQAAIDCVNHMRFGMDKMAFDIVTTALLELPSVQPEWNNHAVACLLAELFDDTCACNYNGIDEWLPKKCELLKSCPNPVGVACWEQYLKHRAERRTDGSD